MALPLRSGPNSGDLGGLADSGTSVHARWRTGVFMPAVIAAWSIFVLITGEMRGRSGNVTGPTARAIGLVVLAIALFWHIQQFWESNKALEKHAFAAKIGAALVLVAALAWLGSSLAG